MTQEEYQKQRALALKLTYDKVLRLFLKNKEILEKHLTLAQRERLGSQTKEILVPSHAALTEAVNTLMSIFVVINKPNEQWECERLSKYLRSWAREELR